MEDCRLEIIAWFVNKALNKSSIIIKIIFQLHAHASKYILKVTGLTCNSLRYFVRRKYSNCLQDNIRT